MNNKAVYTVVGAIIIALVAAYVATSASLEGTSFTGDATNLLSETKELETIKELAETEKTPTDYTIQNLKAEKTETGYIITGRLQNLGTTVTALPSLDLQLNDISVSNLSGIVDYSFVGKDGMNFNLKVAEDMEYLKAEGENTLQAMVDNQNLYEEANEENNSVQIKF